MEDKTLEQMLKDFSRERGNRKSKVLTVKPKCDSHNGNRKSGLSSLYF